MEDRIYYKLGNFAQIYYYMLPHIWYESLLTNILINQSFFIAYEFGDAYVIDDGTGEGVFIKGIYNEFLYFRYPKISDEFNINNNFVPNNYFLNSYIEEEEFIDQWPIDNYYSEVKLFKGIDYSFRSSINTDNNDNNEYDF